MKTAHKVGSQNLKCLDLASSNSETKKQGHQDREHFVTSWKNVNFFFFLVLNRITQNMYKSNIYSLYNLMTIQAWRWRYSSQGPREQDLKVANIKKVRGLPSGETGANQILIPALNSLPKAMIDLPPRTAVNQDGCPHIWPAGLDYRPMQNSSAKFQKTHTVLVHFWQRFLSISSS